MKHSIYPIIMMFTATGLCGACSTHRQMAEQPVSVTPTPCVLTPGADNRAEVKLTFHIPEKTLSRRARLVITPQLMVGDSLRDEYTPLVVDADLYTEKTRRKTVLEAYQDPYQGQQQPVQDPTAAVTLSYQETITLPAATDTARLMAVVSTNGCGQCTGLDTLEVAYIVRPTAYIEWMEPTFTIRPKVRDGQGEAHLQFAINQYDIDLNLGNNRNELDAMTQALAPVLKDTLAMVNSFTITGMASADGPLKLNTTLARNRAEAAKQYIVRQLALTDEQAGRIHTDSRPEGWQPILQAMTDDGHPDSARVADILRTLADQDDDIQERRIRRLPCWNDIKTRYLAKDRKVEYTYSYTLRSFTTDREVLVMYAKRPDAFNEEELLRAATLMPTDAEKMEVYRTLLSRYPQCETAINNLAYLCLRTGHEAEARRLLDKLPERYPNVASKQLKLREEDRP